MRKEPDVEQTNRAAAEHVERTRRRLSEGRETIDRLHESVEETNRHLEDIGRWIEETDRQLREEREGREPGEPRPEK